MILSGTTKKGKNVTLSDLSILLPIKEIDLLIDFLKKAKEDFILNKQSSYCSQCVCDDKTGEITTHNITSYKELTEKKFEYNVVHNHLKDYLEEGNENQPDIVLYTSFAAKENADGTFHWENEIAKD